MISAEIKVLAQKLWNYHQMGHHPAESDCILVLGSHDLRVADRAAQLYLEGFAPLILFSGGLGNYTRQIWTVTEAEQFAAIAVGHGVPAKDILVEDRSTNTGENILFSQQLLAARNHDPESFLVVQKPYMERRSYATFKRHWPDKQILVTSPQISFDDYPTPEIPVEKVINNMVGNLHRIRVYPEMGFQVYQEIPPDVWEAGQRLIALGFTKYLASS